ncbi:hypothetical protein CRG98_039973 [Punica granatum]|uniref:Aminoacyl-tRNA synthetase class Ia domain-containing protein n=1 Tax=Punica granatum TaxID=22663 RepID=A0A2I0I8C4_PUNGR|nr:hypothetical protein CRG98_039973 [Punica granatum]
MAAIIAQKGSDAWWYMKVVDLLPGRYHDEASNYERGADTLDVWFDSGHGFVLDEKGLKMSISLGNFDDPHTVMEGGKNQKEAPAFGADVLRLWGSSVEYTTDVTIGPQALRQISDIYRNSIPLHEK